MSHETVRAVLRRSPFTASYRRHSRDGAEAAAAAAAARARRALGNDRLAA